MCKDLLFSSSNVQVHVGTARLMQPIIPLHMTQTVRTINWRREKRISYVELINPVLSICDYLFPLIKQQRLDLGEMKLT